MKSIFHVGITVKNLDVTMPFYRDVLGLKVQVPPTDWFYGEALSKGINVPDAKLRVCIFEIGDSGDTLEILEYKNPPSPIDKPMPTYALGAVHVAFRVTDISKKVKELEAKGIKCFDKPITVTEGPFSGWSWVYFIDPDGITWELVQVDAPKK